MASIVAGDGLVPGIGHAGVMATETSAAGTIPQPRNPGEAYQICVVCLGNICRSPMAEVVLRDELEKAGLAGKVEVDSAGTGDWHIGESMDSRARAELSSRGYDGSGHEARQIRSSWLGRYDLLLAMDRHNHADLKAMAAGDPDLAGRIQLMRDFDPGSPPGAEVPDPYGGGQDDWTEAFGLVQSAARALAGQLAAEL
jgi:protein-tyrosine phosphatase